MKRRARGGRLSGVSSSSNDTSDNDDDNGSALLGAVGVARNRGLESGASVLNGAHICFNIRDKCFHFIKAVAFILYAAGPDAQIVFLLQVTGTGLNRHIKSPPWLSNDEEVRAGLTNARPVQPACYSLCAWPIWPHMSHIVQRQNVVQHALCCFFTLPDLAYACACRGRPATVGKTPKLTLPGGPAMPLGMPPQIRLE